MDPAKLGPPQGLTLTLNSGATVPCDAKYIGVTDEGIEAYVPVLEYDLDKLMGQVVGLHVDHLPHGVGVQMPGGPDGNPIPMTCGNRTVRVGKRYGTWRTPGGPQ